MKTKTPLEDQLTEALYAFNLAQSDLEFAENAYFSAENAYSSAYHEYNLAFYDYVRSCTPENYDRQHQAAQLMSYRNQKANEAKLNRKLAVCKFKKAKRLYEKLKRKQEKQQEKY